MSVCKREKEGGRKGGSEGERERGMEGEREGGREGLDLEGGSMGWTNWRLIWDEEIKKEERHRKKVGRLENKMM